MDLGGFISNHVTGIVASILAIAAIVVPIWRSRRRYAIRWVILPPKSMMEIAREVSKLLKITFDGQPIGDLTKFTFILHNSGLSAIDKESIVSALKWTGPGTVLTARSIATDPPVELDIKYSENHVEFKWLLFNQHCKALIEVLCAHGSGTDRGTISGQIRDVPRIDTKEISYFDEEEARKRIIANTAHWPRYLGMFSVFVNRWSRTILYLYATAIPAVFAWHFVEEENWIGVVLLSVAIAMVVCVLLLRHLTRNRYLRLIRKGKRSGSRISERPTPQEDQDSRPN